MDGVLRATVLRLVRGNHWDFSIPLHVTYPHDLPELLLFDGDSIMDKLRDNSFIYKRQI